MTTRDGDFLWVRAHDRDEFARWLRKHKVHQRDLTSPARRHFEAYNVRPLNWHEFWIGQMPPRTGAGVGGAR